MSRRTLILVFCITTSIVLWARPSAATTAVFDPATAASVWAAALSYIAPRSLQPLTVPQMTVWGLNGLTALDPDLTAALQDNQIRLYGPEQLLIAVPAPPPADAAAWGKAAAAVAGAAYNASPALQQAGTQGIIESFFDELFNHFDPYSRYEPPIQAAQDQLMITGVAGTGFSLLRQGDKIVIGTVAPDSPGAEAGVKPAPRSWRSTGGRSTPASSRTSTPTSPASRAAPSRCGCATLPTRPPSTTSCSPAASCRRKPCSRKAPACRQTSWR